MASAPARRIKRQGYRESARRKANPGSTFVTAQSRGRHP
ncbi:Hypothetical protein CAP_7481 [Chondromyces apiculatus DSM 436]|uniref:Uncharacterized protein n=1 Tax=Chondromyces apiculatus DSM 436 TaxID=1192034 RepID=A0A017T0R9_9BACT|nr:Hypothetical protein CAP_7481 [Chondromyces apiculatus DSM 436]